MAFLTSGTHRFLAPRADWLLPICDDEPSGTGYTLSHWQRTQRCLAPRADWLLPICDDEPSGTGYTLSHWQRTQPRLLLLLTRPNFLGGESLNGTAVTQQ